MTAHPTDRPSTSDDAPPSKPAEDLRDELRVGVRMLQALDTQLKRAETLIQREDEAARRAEQAIERLARRVESIDVVEPRTDVDDAPRVSEACEHAVARVQQAADEAARGLHDRLERFVTLDTRLDELDATVRTLERRLERATGVAANPPASPTTTSSGTLSVEPRGTTPVGSTTPTETALVDTLVRTNLLVDRGEEVRRELRRDLAAICAASGTLVEIVEQAAETETRLRERLETVTPSDGSSPQETPSTAFPIASILRRLADEFEGAASGSEPVDATATGISTRTTASRPTTIPPIRPVELELGDVGEPPAIPRREPLGEPGSESLDESIASITDATATGD